MNRIFFLLMALFCLSLPAVLFAQVSTGDAELDAAFMLIVDRDFERKSEGVEMLANAKHPKAIELLRSVLDGSLRYIKSENKIVRQSEKDGDYIATDAITEAEIGAFSKRKFKKVSINNAIRSQIKSLLSALELTHPDPQVRHAAIKNTMQRDQPIDAAVLTELLSEESDPDIRQTIEGAIQIAGLSADTAEQRLVAIAAVKNNISPAVTNKLTEVAENDEDVEVRTAAASMLAVAQRRVQYFAQLETFFFGLSLGSVLVLAAIGLAITFGVMGVINMAHGELIMLGAYVTYIMQQLLPNATGLALLLSIPAAFVVAGAFGIAIERGVIRYLYGRPLETLLATFGISLILQQLVRTVVSAQNVAVANPEFLSGSWQINPVLSLTYNRLYIFFFCLIVFTALALLLRYSRLGLEVRAVSQNRDMARSMGVNSARVDALTFGLGSGIAGIAGVALSQLTNVGPNLGQAYIVDSFMVVVFGGVGNLWGTLIGGLALGVGNKFLEPWAGAVLAKIVILAFIILFIQRRPRGMFPQKGRAAES